MPLSRRRGGEGREGREGEGRERGGRREEGWRRGKAVIGEASGFRNGFVH